MERIVVCRDVWEDIKKAAKKKADEIPNGKCRIKADTEAKAVIDCIESVGIACEKDVTVGDRVIVRHAVNFGSKKWPYFREICEEYKVTKVTEKCIFSYSHRFSKESIAAFIEE